MPPISSTLVVMEQLGVLSSNWQEETYLSSEESHLKEVSLLVHRGELVAGEGTVRAQSPGRIT